VANLFALLKLFVSHNTYKNFVQDYRDKKIRYVQVKEVLAEAIYKELRPFQEKRKEFERNPKLVDSILDNSLVKCHQIAEETMAEVKDKMGL
ncbi:hypothetical protein M1615_00850, partial [Patescibacteria group bacterium]|nr:hypothetical protein [Patescibacteria group bacterium]